MSRFRKGLNKSLKAEKKARSENTGTHSVDANGNVHTGYFDRHS